MKKIWNEHNESNNKEYIKAPIPRQWFHKNNWTIKRTKDSERIASQWRYNFIAKHSLHIINSSCRPKYGTTLHFISKELQQIGMAYRAESKRGRGIRKFGNSRVAMSNDVTRCVDVFSRIRSLGCCR